MFENAEVISRYTRAQALADGVLIDLSHPELVDEVKGAGFVHHIAMTHDAFDLAVWPISPDRSSGPDDGLHVKWLKSKCQDMKGRLWDVLWMLKMAIRRAGPNDYAIFYTLSIMNHLKKRRTNIQLKAVCGPGDNGEPVITIMLPNED